MPEKYDDKKLRWDLLPYPALEEVVRVLTDGADRYGDHNWFREDGLEYSRLFAAAQRHLVAWWQGEDTSPDHGFSHLAHAASSLLTLLSYQQWHYQQNDDRPRFARPDTTGVTAANSSDTVRSPGGVTNVFPYKNPTGANGICPECKAKDGSHFLGCSTWPHNQPAHFLKHGGHVK